MSEPLTCDATGKLSVYMHLYITYQYIGVVGDKKEIASLNGELQNQFLKLTLLGFFEARKRYVSFCCCCRYS